MKKLLVGLAALLAVGNMAFAGATLYDKDGTKVEIATDVRFGVQAETASETTKDKDGNKTGSKTSAKYVESLDRAKLYLNFTKGAVTSSLVTDAGALHRDSFVKLNLTDALYLQYNYNHNQLFVGDQLEWRWGNNANGVSSKIIAVEGKNGLRVGMKSGNIEVIGGLLLDAPASPSNVTTKDKDDKVTADTGEGRIGLKGAAIATIDKNMKIIGEAAFVNENVKTLTGLVTTAGIKYAENGKTGVALGARAEVKTSDTMTIKPELLLVIESQGKFKSKKSDDTTSEDQYKKDATTFEAALKVEQPTLDVGAIAAVQTIGEKKGTDGTDKVKSSEIVITPFVEMKKLIGDAGVYVETAIGSKSVETVGVNKVESFRITPKVLVKYKF